MNCKVILGKVQMNGVNSFEIDENIQEISNTAKIVIPRAVRIAGKPILDYIKVGDKVSIDAGYNGELVKQFVGYIREIEANAPTVIHCDDEMFLLKRNSITTSYKDATLDHILSDILKDIPIEYDCPDVRIGKYQIDNASSYIVLQDLMKHYGLYSRIQDSILKVGLSYEFGKATKNHLYTIYSESKVKTDINVKSTDLKYKRKEDFNVRYKAIANNPNGKKTTVIIGSKDKDASERTLNFAGPLTEEDLRTRAIAVMSKLVYDGYTGSITGFGVPTTHAGDSLTIKDYENPEREGTYLIEKVSIRYGDNGFQRENTLSYKL